MGSERSTKRSFAALLLAQVGAQGAKKFAERLQPLGLTPAHAGILRMLAQSSGLSQRELATRLHMHASRLVGVVDEMEKLGLVMRNGNAEDRRSYSLGLTAKGRETMREVGKISMLHNAALCAALSGQVREVLVGLLQRIADEQGLTHGVHPGYAQLGEERRARTGETKRDENRQGPKPIS